ncbi:MAG: uroporphyrinogen decarboxylase family protein, partial [Pseudomonadota bacterium]|nr:uroporphyrinogen decarboxylase family protein [Pseudomonadota bacterium]
EPTREIVARIHAVNPEVPIIGFPRKAGEGYAAYVSETGVDGISFDQSVSLEWAKTQLQPICTVQGNLDNEILLTGGAALDCQVLEILETLSNGPFIFNLGHGVLPETPLEHVGQMVELIRNWVPGG